MAKAPTNKSRMMAQTGVGLIAIGLVLDAWFSPPLPRFCIPTFGSMALIMMQLAKKTREYEGAEIPESVIKRGASIANTEVGLALTNGLCVMAILAMELLNVPRRYERNATIVTLVIFAITSVVFRFTRVRFDTLMKSADVDLAAR